MPRSRAILANPLIDRMPVKPFYPIAGPAAVARSGGQGRPDACSSIEALFARPRMRSGSGRRSLALDGSENGGRLSACRDGRVRVTICQPMAMLSVCALLLLGSVADAAQVSLRPALKPCAGTSIVKRGDWSSYVCEAAKRFDLPERLIRSVMHVESFGDVHAVSPKGAIGLMQIMPATWEELRIKYGLGDDPFDPRSNTMAGAAYLREMLDRFGPKGFLAAYNAGPQRYQEHLSKGRPLPRETIDYVATLIQLINGDSEISPRSRGMRSRSSADRSPLFERHAAVTNDADAVDQAMFTEIRSGGMPSRVDTAVSDLTALEPSPNTVREDARHTPKSVATSLFIARTSGASR